MSCNCHSAPNRDEEPYNETDPARKSVAQALQTSFRILTVLMILVIVGFFATGIASIEQDEQGLVILGGQIQRTVGPGMVITWPFPYGEIERVSTKTRSMKIDDFWMQLDARQMSQKLEDLTWFHGGLRPGIDGALLTGNQNLYHVKIRVEWQVVDAEKFVSNLADPDQTIRDAVCRAVVQVAATFTARKIEADVALGKAEDKEQVSSFSKKIKAIVVDDLKHLNSGIKIENVLIPEKTWPIATLSAFKKSQEQLAERETAISAARAISARILREAAGMAFVELVGDPTEQNSADQGGLIGKYDRAMDANDHAEADKILVEIDKVLSGGNLSGEARAIIADAKAYRSTVEQALIQRTDRFEKLLPRYQSSDPTVRKLLVFNLLASARKKIMSGEDIEIIKIIKNSKNPYVFTLPNIPEDDKDDEDSDDHQE